MMTGRMEKVKTRIATLSMRFLLGRGQPRFTATTVTPTPRRV